VAAVVEDKVDFQEDSRSEETNESGKAYNEQRERQRNLQSGSRAEAEQSAKDSSSRVVSVWS